MKERELPVMLALYLSPIYIVLNVYLLLRMMRWMEACHHICEHPVVRVGFIILYILLATSLLTGFLLPEGELKRICKLIGNYWLGVLLYTSLTVLTADLLRILLNINPRIRQNPILHTRTFFAIAGGICAVIIIALSTWGVVNARIIHTTPYNVTVHKSARTLSSLNVVLVADLHMGYNIGKDHISNMVQKTNAQDPDLVVIAGDIFDNEYESLKDPEEPESILRGIQSKYGVYACYGNHDIEEKILAGFTFDTKNQEKASDPRMDEFLEKANIRLLRDEGILVDNSFYLFGRADASRPGKDIDSRKTPAEITADMDKRKPILVIDHQPKELSELSAAGVDLDLCGHTHDGQMFPGNLTVRLMWENSCGYLQKDNMLNIVTSGVGIFGPNMRIGTKAEICPIHITFEP